MRTISKHRYEEIIGGGNFLSNFFTHVIEFKEEQKWTDVNAIHTELTRFGKVYSWNQKVIAIQLELPESITKESIHIKSKKIVSEGVIEKKIKSLLPNSNFELLEISK